MQDIFEDNLLIVCPQEEKLKLLKQATTSNTLYNIKFMTKEEYKQNYYFSYDEKTLLVNGDEVTEQYVKCI